MRKLPSPWSIIYTDNVCWAMFSVSPAVLFLALMVKLTGTLPGKRGGPDTPIDPAAATLVLAGAVVLLLFLAAIVAWRVARVRRLFEEGRELEASVRKVKYFRGGSSLWFQFEVNGIPYEVKSTFQRWLRPPVFNEGTRIPVMVDPASPKHAVPRALYDDPGAAPSSDRPIPAEQRSWAWKLKNRP